MGLLLFFLLILIAAIAAGVQALIARWPADVRGLNFVACFVAYALLLTLPAILPILIGGG